MSNLSLIRRASFRKIALFLLVYHATNICPVHLVDVTLKHPEITRNTHAYYHGADKSLSSRNFRFWLISTLGSSPPGSFQGWMGFYNGHPITLLSTGGSQETPMMIDKRHDHNSTNGWQLSMGKRGAVLTQVDGPFQKILCISRHIPLRLNEVWHSRQRVPFAWSTSSRRDSTVGHHLCFLRQFPVSPLHPSAAVLSPCDVRIVNIEVTTTLTAESGPPLRQDHNNNTGCIATDDSVKSSNSWIFFNRTVECSHSP